MTTETLTIHYAIDQAAALAAGHAFGTTVHHLALTDAMLAACAPEDRTFLARSIRMGWVDLMFGYIDGRQVPYPQRDALLTAEDVPAFVASCRATYEAAAAALADERAVQALHEARRDAERAHEREVLAHALVAPVAQVIGFMDAGMLYGSRAAEDAARATIRAWLASASLDLAGYWDAHGTGMDLGKAAIAGVARHVENMRAERAAARKAWVDDMVTFFGDDNARARRAAGVLPRQEVEDLVWHAIQAPDGHDVQENCPRCGDERAESEWVSGKPVSAAVWDAAQAIAAAFHADTVETLGLALTRDIVLVTYDCPACEPSHRFELRVELAHPENGWLTRRARYYPLEDV